MTLPEPEMTSVERRCLMLVTEGNSVPDIARLLGCSAAMVLVHLMAARDKFAAPTVIDAAIIARRSGC
ncbi:DNA-binding CsgD family transcriptional regulator [Hoeflea marina]|uniref:DNA-binding CsgD family transcriptional regulator n=1 Tax=Hoeflea marina TaxID=274592 RepID=A0A317PBW6_9HYPH|nr:helix-turn-helix transcriptional regulator [Hoeflea marina]PWV95479.1 DNA-binding CsgD family transcriptional regulator [Hoeflea marina]